MKHAVPYFGVFILIFLLNVGLFLEPSTSLASNRYSNTAALYQFPAPKNRQIYDFNSPSQFLYAVSYASAAIRYAAHAVYWDRRDEAPVKTMRICDCSTAEGDTPDGRHPGNAHDGGVNFDITYYLKRDVSSFIVCPQNGDNHCTGPATDLDACRQAYFFASLGKLAYALGDRVGNHKFIDLIAVDYAVESNQDYQAQLTELATHPEYGFTPQEIELTKDLVYSEKEEGDQPTGWYRFHHHHNHIRFMWNPQKSKEWQNYIETKLTQDFGVKTLATANYNSSADEHPSFWQRITHSVRTFFKKDEQVI